MNVQVPKLARKLGQALEPIKRVHYFGITYDYRCFVFVCVCVCVCVCMRVCARACCTSFPKITSIISSSTYCKNLLDEVVMKIKNYLLAISVLTKIWVTKVVLPWLVAQNL